MRVMKRIPWPVWVAPFLVGMILLAARVQIVQATPETYPAGAVHDTLFADRDTYINTGDGGENSDVGAIRGLGTTIIVGINAIPDTNRVLVHWDISGIPAASAIVTAHGHVVTTKAQAAATTSTRYTVARMMRDWTENQAAWMVRNGTSADSLWTAPGAYSAMPRWACCGTAYGDSALNSSTIDSTYDQTRPGVSTFGPRGAIAAGDTLQFDMTEYVRNWVSGRWSNYGVMLSAFDETTTNRHVTLISREYDDETFVDVPTLFVVYVPADSIGIVDTLTVTETDTVTVGTGRRRVGPGRVGPQ